MPLIFRNGRPILNQTPTYTQLTFISQVCARHRLCASMVRTVSWHNALSMPQYSLVPDPSNGNRPTSSLDMENATRGFPFMASANGAPKCSTEQFLMRSSVRPATKITGKEIQTFINLWSASYLIFDTIIVVFSVYKDCSIEHLLMRSSGRPAKLYNRPE